MTNREAIKWLNNLMTSIGEPQYSSLWHYEQALSEIKDMLRVMPPVDAVQVVRCKDCRFHEQEQPGMVYCPATGGGWVEENWFCKGGERRSE